jgi:hypothetical protein
MAERFSDIGTARTSLALVSIVGHAAQNNESFGYRFGELAVT